MIVLLLIGNDCDDKLSGYESAEMKLRNVLHCAEHNSNKEVG